MVTETGGRIRRPRHRPATAAAAGAPGIRLLLRLAVSACIAGRGSCTPIGGTVEEHYPTNLPDSGFPGPTPEATNASFSLGYQPERLGAWPQLGYGLSTRTLLPCHKKTFLHDVERGWPDLCMDLFHAKRFRTMTACKQFCLDEPRCSVWQYTNQSRTPECWVGYGIDCGWRNGNGNEITVQGGQRIMHGEVQILKNMTGWRVYKLFKIGHYHIGNERVSILRCKGWCYSDIGCQYWQYDQDGCWVDAPFFTSMGSNNPVNVVQYPLTTNGGVVQDITVVAGEYIQHYCPPRKTTPPPQMMLPSTPTAPPAVTARPAASPTGGSPAEQIIPDAAPQGPPAFWEAWWFWWVVAGVTLVCVACGILLACMPGSAKGKGQRTKARELHSRSTGSRSRVEPEDPTSTRPLMDVNQMALLHDLSRDSGPPPEPPRSRTGGGCEVPQLRPPDPLWASPSAGSMSLAPPAAQLSGMPPGHHWPGPPPWQGGPRAAQPVPQLSSPLGAMLPTLPPPRGTPVQAPRNAPPPTMPLQLGGPWGWPPQPMPYPM